MEEGNYGRKLAVQTDQGTINVSIASKKLLTFRQSLSCAGCGAQGAYFLLLRNPLAKNRCSLELFTDEGELMTRDHILPKSLGGGNEMGNSQTMCLVCNSEKGSKIL
ncbi:MAG: HNH endonuclease [Armatimonadetes bacterium]|nr:HNH endonuclease [Armatimonadota bacterium]